LIPSAVADLTGACIYTYLKKLSCVHLYVCP